MRPLGSLTDSQLAQQAKRGDSPAFSELWARYEVGPRVQEDKHFRHPDVGDLRLHFEKLTIASAPGQHLSVYSAETGSPDADKLAVLVRLGAAGHQESAPSAREAAGG